MILLTIKMNIFSIFVLNNNNNNNKEATYDTWMDHILFILHHQVEGCKPIRTSLVASKSQNVFVNSCAEKRSILR